MFNISKLEMYDYNDKSFTYSFKRGINYFIGKNNSGKTEFYKFIDYMFGSSEKINNRSWYRGTLKKATMYFTYNDIVYRLTRVLDNDDCFFSYNDEQDGDPINLLEYKDRLNAVFSVNKSSIEELHKFTGERLTYRTFTLFSFLGELHQGVLVDFFDKCSEIQCSTKITLILNYIFNPNIERIFWLQNNISKLQKEIREKEEISSNSNLIINKINMNLQKLNMKDMFNGFNGKTILDNLSLLSEKFELLKPMETKNTLDLEIAYNNITEQIKVYEKYKEDLKNQEIENINRETMLETFHNIISNNNEYEYLVSPLIELINEIKSSIAFSQYIIKDEVLAKLKKQKKCVKNEIMMSHAQMTRFKYEDKMKAITIAEDGINSFPKNIPSKSDLDELKKKLNGYKKELKDLQASDDINKIKSIGTQITELYKSAYNTSDFVKKDFDSTKNRFHIKYIKRRNSLQTMTEDEKGNEIVHNTGSHARNTLIQLCGYLIFLKMLMKENRYPIIPILVIDHISKPFSDQNIAAIGTVISKFYEYIGTDDFQIFMFDDENSEKLNIEPNHKENLVTDRKTGFNPFFNFSD